MDSSIEERILYEDNHLIVLNKLPGELVQGDRTGDEPLLEKVKSFIKVRDQKPGNVYLGSPHRLDRPVSGLVIFTKTSKALTRMNEKFRDKEVNKVYWAITYGQPKEKAGRLEGWMKKNPKQNKSYVSREERADHKWAALSYTLRYSADRYSLLEVKLETGRHHQIRAQLAEMGSIIKGDLKYGAPRSNSDASISLHARSVAFTHPVTKQEVKLTAPTPHNPLWTIFVEAVG